MSRKKTIGPGKKSTKSFVRVFLIGMALAAVATGIYLLFIRSTAVAPTVSDFFSGEETRNKDLREPAKPEITTSLQPVVDSWAARVPGEQGIVIQDINSGKILASLNGQEQYFAASIYKLYVAYVGYQLVDDSTYSLDEPYQGGRTRGECLDAMIRSSDSPCAEKMWVEIGKEDITRRLEDYGLIQTSMTGLTTSAGDAAIVLKRLEEGKDLKDASRTAFLDSMLHQIYRTALPAGFTPAKVYDKVGFRGTAEYHDTAIVRFADGSGLIVSVLTSGTGTKNISALAADIKRAVNK